MANTVLYDFKTGYPDLSLIPRERIDQFMHAIMLHSDALQYAGELPGTMRARTQIARLVAELYGMPTSVEEVIVTTGALSSADTTCRALTQPGDVVIVESPTFFFAVTIFQMSRVQVVGVPIRSDGIDLEALERTLKEYGSRVKLFYAIPAFHNPTGICYSVENRKALLALAERHNFTILEDVTYQPLYYGAAPPPIIRSFDTSGRVVTIASVSKLVMPALRVGWVYAAPPMIATIQRFKGDGGTSMFNTEVVSAYIESGEFGAQIEAARRFYARKHDVMAAAMDRHMPDWLNWSAPGGGYFIWASVPDGMSAASVIQAAQAHGIEIFPGAASYADVKDDSHLRLCFAYLPEPMIEAGIAAFGKVLQGQR